MVQVFSYRPLTTEARFQSEASAITKCVVCKLPLGQVYFRVLGFVSPVGITAQLLLPERKTGEEK